jgi:hypothetical protein
MNGPAFFCSRNRAVAELLIDVMICRLTGSLVRSFARLLVCSFARLLVCSFARLLVCSFARLLVCSFARLPIQFDLRFGT